MILFLGQLEHFSNEPEAYFMSTHVISHEKKFEILLKHRVRSNADKLYENMSL